MAKTHKQELVIEFQRIRQVKPQFFSHEGLFDAEAETGLPVRVAFIGLWTCCDKNGRFEWKPRSLKLKILPYDMVDFEQVLQAFVKVGSVEQYEVDGKKYGYIPSWTKHQYISTKERQVKTSCPPPPGFKDMPESDGDIDPSGIEEEMDTASVLDGNRTGPGAEPSQAERNGVGIGVVNGNGKEVEKKRSVNVAADAAQSHPQPHTPLSSFHSLQPHSQSQSHPQPRTRSRDMSHFDELDRAFAAGELLGSSPEKPSEGEDLAKTFYSVLPEQARSGAPANWKELWGTDFDGLVKIHSFETVRHVIEAFPQTRFAKYVVRAVKFVEMFEDIKKTVERLAVKKAAKAALSSCSGYGEQKKIHLRETNKKTGIVVGQYCFTCAAKKYPEQFPSDVKKQGEAA